MVDLSFGRECNNACVMCITPSKTPKNPPLSEIKQLIDSLRPQTQIFISGGESTIRKDFFEILDYLGKKQPKAEITLLTNARMFSYKGFLNRVLNETRISKIITELHASAPALHDKITMVPGSFGQTLSGIYNILATGIVLEVRIVIHKMNYTHLPDTSKFIIKNLKGIQRVVMFPINIIGRALEEDQSVVVKSSQITPFIMKSLDIARKNNFPMIVYHCPRCLIGRSYWKFCAGVTAPPTKIAFAQCCSSCVEKPRCSGLWRSYADIVGNGELKPIKNEKD